MSWNNHYQPGWTSLRKGMHVVFWIVYFLYMHLTFSPVPFRLNNIITSAVFASIHIIAVYTNFFVLIPKILNQRRYILYGISLLLSVVFFSFLLGFALYLWFQIVHPPIWEAWVNDRELLVGSIMGSTTSIMFLTTCIRLVRQHIYFDERRRQVEKEQTETELRFLKNQLNPHFLFNALNSIYFLIRKDPNLAEESLAGFSDLLRYQLYGANEKGISLQKELAFLQKYAALAQIRKKEDLKVRWELPEHLNGEQIAPLLLLPFVENAFKHVANKAGYINISLQLEQQKLRLQLVNNIAREKRIEPELQEGGIGLSNVKRRLELLYPNNHQLLIKEAADQFDVLLEIPFTKNSLEA